MKLFFKYFSKYCKTNNLNKYKEKLNLRTFNDLKNKVYENIQLKSNDLEFKNNSNNIYLSNVLKDNNDNNKILKSNNENKTNYYKNDDYSNNNNSSNNDMLAICTVFAAV